MYLFQKPKTTAIVISYREEIALAPKIIVVLNQKGGVGKTTFVCHLAYAAAHEGKTALVVDLDTQRNATATLAGRLDGFDHGAAEQIATATTPEEIQPFETDTPGISLLYGMEHLDWIDSELNVAKIRQKTDLIRSLPYDCVIFDTPPSIGPRHLAPLFWAHVAYLPVEPSQYSISGLAQCLRALHAAQQTNPRLTYQLLINRLKSGSSSHKAAAAELCAIAPFRQPFLTERIAVNNALAQRRPVWELREADSRLRKTWLDLCKELVA